MNHYQRMLAVINGEESGRIPFCPRMDLWYIANRARGTLPEVFINKDIVGIARELGVCCHAMGSDSTLSRPPESRMLQGFGIENHKDFSYRVELKDLPIDFHAGEGDLVTRIITEAGEINCRMRYTDEMIKNGISGPFVKSYPFKSVRDLEPLGQFFEHLEVIPTPDNYLSFQQRVGDQGLAVTFGIAAASPVHLLHHDLMPIEQFFYLYMDDRKSMYRLTERIEPFFDDILEATIASPAEVILWGANFDAETTYPPFFEKEILPWLKKACRRIHEAGKLALCHLDGENSGLFHFYKMIDFDIAESVCTSPMVKNTLSQIRRELGNRKTVWGGIPSVALLPESMSDNDFEDFLISTFKDLGSGDHLVFGVSDNVPPGADLNRIEKIREKIERYK
jgi:uroporphyrinogen-III decarboxylase